MGIIVYVAGPISASKAPDGNRAAFLHAAARLRAYGYSVINPTDNTIDYPVADEQSIWQQYMRISVGQIASADGVCTLGRWLDSRGATLEVFIAAQLGLKVAPLAEWISHSPPAGDSYANVTAPCRQCGTVKRIAVVCLHCIALEAEMERDEPIYCLVGWPHSPAVTCDQPLGHEGDHTSGAIQWSEA